MGRKAEEGDGDEDAEKGFFACYLLTSLNPRFKGHTYIGFTVNPRRRIRQHNGEIGCGAFRTKTKRPWEMVLCIHGFPTNVSALKFEWAWQHPTESLAVRQAAASFKSLSGLANKIKLAYTMLALPPWQSLNITVNYFSTKYKQHSAGCPSLPEQMKVTICPMDELPCYSEGDDTTFENEDDWGGSEECDKDNRVDETLPELVTDAVTMGRDGHCKTNADSLGCIEDYGKRQIRDSSTSGKVYDEPFGSINSPVRALSSIHNGTSNISVTAEDKGKRQLRDSPARARKSSSTVASFSNVTATARDRNAFGLHRESNFELGWSGREELSSCNASREVEIIDVFTPSSSIRPIAEDRDTFAWIGDNGKRQLRDSPTKNSPSRRPSSIPTGASNITETAEGGDTFARIEVNGKRQSRNSPARARTSSTTVTSSSYVTATAGGRHTLGLHRESSCTVSREVEIIDVFTPSPDRRVGLRCKKRRVASTCPEIIDLTRSPVFVQL